MYKNEILNNLFTPTSDKETIVLNTPFVSSFVPNVSDESIYLDAITKTFDAVSSMKLDAEFIRDYAAHLNVNKVLDVNGFTTDNLTYLRDGITHTVFHQFLHKSDTLLKAISYEANQGVDMTPLFQEFVDTHNRMGEDVAKHGHMALGAHLINSDTLDEIWEGLSFYAHVNLTHLSDGFIKENLDSLFDPLQVYVVSKNVSMEFIESKVNLSEEYDAIDVMQIIQSYQENDPEGTVLTKAKEYVLTRVAKELLEKEMEEAKQLL